MNTRKHKHISKSWTRVSIIPNECSQANLLPTNLTTMVFKRWPPNLSQSSPQPWFTAPINEWSSSPLFSDSYPFHLPGMFRWLAPWVDVRVNSCRLGNPMVPLLGLTTHKIAINTTPSWLPLLIPNRNTGGSTAQAHMRGRVLVKKKMSVYLKVT